MREVVRALGMVMWALLVVAAAGLGSPALAQNPHGAGQMAAPRDMSVDSPDVPQGTIVANILDADRKPVAGAVVELGIIHNSVAKGESRDRESARTNEEGLAQFQGLDVGMGHSYRIAVRAGEATFASDPFALANDKGKLVTLHVYESTTDINAVMVGIDGRVFMSFKEGAIQIEQQYSIYNFSKRAWVANVSFPLPEDYQAFVVPETMVESPFSDTGSGSVALKGTFPPGQYQGSFRYQIPLSGDTAQTLNLPLPPRVIRAQVISQAGPGMGMSVSGFRGAERVESPDGRTFLITDHTSEGATQPIRQLDVTLTGLPTGGIGRWIAVALALIALVGAGLYVRERKTDTELADDTREDLLEAREALLGELVELERARRRGDVGPKSYDSVRAALLEALSRIVAQLEPASPAAAAAAASAGPATVAKTKPKRRPRSSSTSNA